jgi:hypothetical protein
MNEAIAENDLLKFSSIYFGFSFSFFSSSVDYSNIIFIFTKNNFVHNDSDKKRARIYFDILEK